MRARCVPLPCPPPRPRPACCPWRPLLCGVVSMTAPWTHPSLVHALWSLPPEHTSSHAWAPLQAAPRCRRPGPPPPHPHPHIPPTHPFMQRLAPRGDVWRGGARHDGAPRQGAHPLPQALPPGHPGRHRRREPPLGARQGARAAGWVAYWLAEEQRARLLQGALHSGWGLRSSWAWRRALQARPLAAAGPRAACSP